MEKNQNKREEDVQLNEQHQGVDKAPGEETGKSERVSVPDLKGKKVDADPSRDTDQPVR